MRRATTPTFRPIFRGQRRVLLEFPSVRPSVVSFVSPRFARAGRGRRADEENDNDDDAMRGRSIETLFLVAFLFMAKNKNGALLQSIYQTHAIHTMGDDDASVASSIVEFDGMDMNDEEEVVAAAEEEDVMEEEEEEEIVADANGDTDLAKQDDLEMEETRKERMELMAAETKSAVLPDHAQGRFEYLMQQSEVFAHFLAGTWLRLFKSIQSYHFHAHFA